MKFGLFQQSSADKARFGNSMQNLYIPNHQDQLSMARDQEIRKNNIDIDTLMKDFDTEKLSIEADWNEWLKKTSY